MLALTAGVANILLAEIERDVTPQVLLRFPWLSTLLEPKNSRSAESNSLKVSS